MKNSLSSTDWAMSDDLAAFSFEAEEHDFDASAETFSWQTDPRSLLQDLEEAWDEAEDDFDEVY